MTFDPNSKKARRLERTLKLIRLGIITAPASFQNAKLFELDLVCNGCGSARAKFDFVPDTIWGIYIGEACHVHDWDYDEGKTEQDKRDADWRMLKNLIALIYHKARWYSPTVLMCVRATFYYLAVRKHGGSAFWNGKEKP